MLLSLDVIRAKEGDCLILHYGPKDKPRLALIDGGQSGVYQDFLKVRLQQVKDARGIGQNKQLPINLLMVSHMDDDHIVGILDLTRDLIQDDPTFARVLGFWHNSFENIIGEVPEQLTAAFTAQVAAASLEGSPPDLNLDVDLDDKVLVPSLKLLASIKKGAKLRKDIIDGLGSELNVNFGGALIAAEENAEAVDVGGGLKFTVVGPMLPELKRLHAEHQAWLRGLAKDGKTPEEVLAAYADKSPTNLSSIVVLAEAEGKRILFTGDALGNKIMEGLELVGLIDKGGSLHVDILKVQHHGSSNNADVDFFQRITADHYVFSGNGDYGNPERETLDMLLRGRGEEDEYTIHLTYPVSEIDAAREATWEQAQASDRKKQLKNPNKEVRPDWSPEKQSLRAFFKEHKEFAKRLSIVEDGEPHVIDLLDEVGF
jgi:hypothetical protein